MSIALASTVGVVAIAWFWLLVEKFVVGAIFPFFTFGLMVGSYFLAKKLRAKPLDPQHTCIQLGIIVGGYSSVAIAYFGTGKVRPYGLLYCGGGMALVALISVLLDQVKVARLNSAAEKAMIKAKEAKALARDGDTKSADEMLQEALLTSELAYGSGHPQVATIVFYMAELMKQLERSEAATVLYRRAVQIRSEIPDNGRKYVLTMQACADHMRQAGLLDEALSIITRAVSESRRLENSRALTGRCSLTLSRIHAMKGNLQEAYDTGRTAAKLLEASQGKSHPETLQAKALVANQSVNFGRVAEAERILVEVIAEKEKLGENQDPVYLDLLLDLSAVHSRGSIEKSKSALLEAAKLYRSYVGPDYYRAHDLLEKLPALLAEAGPTEMADFYQNLFTGETRTASQILEKAPHIATTIDASGWTTLQWSVFFDNAELTRLSLSHGGDIEAGKGTDFPPLYIGSRWANRAALSTLFRKDPDVEIQAGDGSRPIHGAVLSGDQLTFDQTCAKKAQLEVPNNLGWTPLHYVAFRGDRKFLFQMIQKGLNLDFQAPTTMQTPLHAAILGGQRGAAETLLLNMARVDLKDSSGDTAADLAEKKGDRELLALIEGYSDTKDEESAESPPESDPEAEESPDEPVDGEQSQDEEQA